MDGYMERLGDLLREWRGRRHLSQLALALDVEISQRHLSFVESGRARPSREVVSRLADRLDVPLRARNALLIAAGHAPAYHERPAQNKDLEAAQGVIQTILAGHEPNPALAIDRHWNLITANSAAMRFLTGVDPSLLEPPINVLRVSMHPDGLASKIINYREWRAHVLARLARQIDHSGDESIQTIIDELEAYPVPATAKPFRLHEDLGQTSVAIPLELDVGSLVLKLIATTTIFGTALDIGLAELAIESLFPADTDTAHFLRELGGQSDRDGTPA